MLESVRTSEVFAGMLAMHLWNLWMRYACSAYYSHPWAWNEIGLVVRHSRLATNATDGCLTRTCNPTSQSHGRGRT